MFRTKKRNALQPGSAVTFSSSDPADMLHLSWSIETGDTRVEVACIGLDHEGYELNYLVADHCPFSAEGAVTCDPTQHAVHILLSKVPEQVHRLLLVIGINGAGGLNEWGKSRFQAQLANHEWEWAFHGAILPAVPVLKGVLVYRLKNGTWAMRVEAQGFPGSLALLIKKLAERPEVDENVPLAAPAPLAEKNNVNEMHRRDKKIYLLARHVMEPYQRAQISLDKYSRVANHVTRIVCVLDHSIAMQELYASGQIQRLLTQLSGLSAHWSASGDIDIFLAGNTTHSKGIIQWGGNEETIQSWLLSTPLERRVQFGRAMEVIRRTIYPKHQGGEAKQICKNESPVFVLWIMSHDVDDVGMAQWQLRWASYEPIFWNFMALNGQRGRLKSSRLISRQGGMGRDFRFLDNLQAMGDRALHNADYFTVSTVGDYSVDELYEVMMESYAAWLQEAEIAGMVIRK